MIHCEFEENEIYGSWKILYEIPKEKGKPRKLRCLCLECGNEYDVEISNLRRSKNKMCKSCSNKKTWTKHGLSNHPLYGVFKDMHSRCENSKHKKYKNYGERGIHVCDLWEDTEEGIINFVKWSENNDYKEGLQLDRHNNDLGYSPENCRWVSVSINNFNRRKTKGYRFYKNRWEAYITVNKKTIYLGHYLTEEEAKNARMEAELKYYGEYSPEYRKEMG